MARKYVDDEGVVGPRAVGVPGARRAPRRGARGRGRRDGPVGDATRDAPRAATRPCAASPRGARRGFAPAATRRGGDAPPGAPASATPRAPDDAEGVGEAPAEGRGAGGLAKGCRRMWRMWQGIEARRGGGGRVPRDAASRSE